ncbi:MAG: hypothetical protein V7637_5955 [Mycobacteriales bacterium]
MRERRPLSRRLYLVCLLVAVAGFGVGRLCGQFASTAATRDVGPESARATAPGRTALTLPAGDYTGYFERTGQSETVGDLSCELTDPAHGAVGLSRADGGFTYVAGGRVGVPQFRFHAASAGRYLLDCAYPPASRGRTVALAIAPDTDVTGPVTVLVGLGWLASAVVGAVVVAWQRRRVAWRSDGAARGLVRAAVAVAVAWLAVALGCLLVLAGSRSHAVAAAPVRSPPVLPTTPVDPGQVSFHELRVGDCFDAGRGTIVTVTRRPCDQPHDGEVYAMPTVGRGPWPGQRTVDQRGNDTCKGAFRPYVGVDYLGSDLRISKYPPTERGWLAGDHSVVCVVGELIGKATGRLRGAHR